MKKFLLHPATAIALFSVMMCFVTSFSSCSGSSSGRKDLVKALFSDYTAEVEFLFECDGNSVAGTARVTRDENVRFEITAPDPYTGISVASDASGRSSLLSISYSGIKSEVPKDLLDRLSLAMTLFSDEIACEAENLPTKAFSACEELYTVEGLGEIQPWKTEFTAGTVNYIIVYDSVTGYPLDLCAENEGNALEVKIRKIKTAAQP